MARINEEKGIVPCVEKENATMADDTIIAHVEQIVNIAVSEKLGDDVFQKASESLEFVGDKLGITHRQALLLSLLVELSDSRRIDTSDIAKLTNCRRVRVLSLLSDDRVLIEKGLVVRKKNNGNIEYCVPNDVVNAIKNNEPYEFHRKQLNIDDFFAAVDAVCENAEENNDGFQENVDDLVNTNIHLDFCKTFRKYFGENDSDGALFMIFAHRLINKDDDCIGEHDWEDYFSKGVVRRYRSRFTRHQSSLFDRHLLEEAGSDGIRDNYYHRITNQAKEEFFAGMEGLKHEPKKLKNTREHTSIAEKALYYNDNEGRQMAQLTSLLTAQNFRDVQQRLADCGMRKGFACLFYGTPGTGKTESVYQIARKTERDLIVIDVANIKSCWVGESEKNITETFSKYRQCVETCRAEGRNEPILLFNEADAILGIRMENAQRAVDKSENSIQNIILQGMENLDGIMIATTNLTTNLDKAFERRFIYKIEFCKPNINVKCAIWKSMMPNLTEGLAMQLAEQYDFSGGQIENVARKQAVEHVLTGKEPTAEQLNDYCRQEMLNNKKCNKIGF